MSPMRCHVAVIGAGTAGLVVARELLREGHSVVVLEQSSSVGGSWQVQSAEHDPLGRDSAARTHSSMYPGLRTNLPRYMMSFIDFPFIPEAMGGRSKDDRVYPGQPEVLAFLEAYADAEQLRPHIRFNTTVLRIDPIYDAKQAPVNIQDPASQAHHACSRACICPTAHSCLAERKLHQGCGGCTCSHASTTTSNAQPHSAAANGLDPCTLGCGQPTAHLQPKWCVTVACSSACQHSVSSSTNGSAAGGAAGSAHGHQVLVFDAVVGCVGHHTEPHLPQVPGMETFPGLQMHSHNYRGPQQFHGMQSVVVIGASFSGEEMARHIAGEVHQVLHCARSWPNASSSAVATPPSQHNSSPQHIMQQASSVQRPPQAPQPRSNITRVPMLSALRADGAAEFGGGSSVSGGVVLQHVDAVVYCTGYEYSFPWMQHLGLVTTDDMRVTPLYKHLFVPSVAPTLSLVGLSWKATRPPQFQLQGQLVARALSGRVVLPSEADMLQDMQQMYADLAAAGIPVRYTHCMSTETTPKPHDEWSYAQALSDLAGARALRCAPWLQRLQQLMARGILKKPDTFRDEWDEKQVAVLHEAQAASMGVWQAWLESRSSTPHSP